MENTKTYSNMNYKTKLNKFLSYIHMGNSVFRIYYNKSVELNNETLKKTFIKISETFKKHEEAFSKEIRDLNDVPTKSLTISGAIGVQMEKMKNFSTPTSILYNAVKSTTMGLTSSIKYLKDNQNLPSTYKKMISAVINDYTIIISELTDLFIKYSSRS